VVREEKVVRRGARLGRLPRSGKKNNGQLRKWAFRRREFAGYCLNLDETGQMWGGCL